MTVDCYRCGKKAMNEGEARKHDWGKQYLWGGIVRWFCRSCLEEMEDEEEQYESRLGDTDD